MLTTKPPVLPSSSNRFSRSWLLGAVVPRILKNWRTENVVEVQRQWRREYRTEILTRSTIARIRDKSKTHGTVKDVHKGRPGRNVAQKCAFAHGGHFEQLL